MAWLRKLLLELTTLSVKGTKQKNRPSQTTKVVQGVEPLRTGPASSSGQGAKLRDRELTTTVVQGTNPPDIKLTTNVQGTRLEELGLTSLDGQGASSRKLGLNTPDGLKTKNNFRENQAPGMTPKIFEGK